MRNTLGALVNRLQLVISISSAFALLVGCAGSDYPKCTGPRVNVAGGKCSAYYYQTDYGSGGVTTQALTDCIINGERMGGNIVAFHTLSHGIGLRWLDPNTLEVAVPDGIRLENQHSKGGFLGHQLSYKYRSLRPGEPEFSGCNPQPVHRNK